MVGESSESKKPLRINFKEKQPEPIIFTVPCQEYKENQDVAIVQDEILTEDVEQIVEGDNEEVDTFVNTVMLSQENPDTRIEPWSSKENPEEIEDDDENDNDYRDDHELTNTQATYYKVVRKSDLPAIIGHINDVLHEVVPKIANTTTNELVRDNLPWIMLDDVKKEKEQSKADIPALISQEFDSHALQMIEKLFKTYMQNIFPYDDYPDDNPDQEKSSKRHKTTKGSSYANIIESSNPTSYFKPTTKTQGKKWVSTTVAFHKMKFAYNDIMKSQCKTGAEYEYHLQQIENYMNNQIV
ncbi:hypothetical protein Tco_0780193 [Tanacetum coccineum]